MRIAIIGTGHVGLVQGACFAEVGHDVVCQDIDENKIAVLREGRVPIHEPGLPELVKRNVDAGRLTFTASVPETLETAEVLFVCVGTPPGKRLEGNLTYVEAVAHEVAEHLKPGQYRLIVDKSTVPVKTAERVKRTIGLYAPEGADYGVGSNPEFLREGAAVMDTLAPDRVVVGLESDRDRAILRELYVPVLEKANELRAAKGLPPCTYLATSVRSAELIKHVANSYLSTRLTFINLVARICDAAGADVDEVIEGVTADARIGKAFFRPGIGYGGSCFPKDVPAFARIAEEHGLDVPLLWDVHYTNESQVEWFYDKIERALWIPRNKVLAVWGLAFKQDTDDVRESPSVKLIQLLLDAGATVRTFDPQAEREARKVLAPGGEVPPNLTFCETKEACLKGADALVVGTEWPEFRDADPAAVKAALRLPMVFDGKNALDPQAWRDAGFTYYGVGRDIWAEDQRR